MLILQIVIDVVLMIFVLAFLPLFLGDLLLFANPESGFAFIVFAVAFAAVLWIIDHVTDEYFLQAVSGRLTHRESIERATGARLEASNRINYSCACSARIRAAAISLRR